MNSGSADRNLLFGILAMQMDFISREGLITATTVWIRDKSKPLDQILLEQGLLRQDEYQLMTALVDKHLEKHGHDVEKSLAAISSLGPDICVDLGRLADPDVDASLLQVTVAHVSEDRHATQSITIGEPTAAGKRFRVLRPHAQGGLGQVSVALDEELHREVALKEIQPQHADQPTSRERFVKEAEVTGALEHPGIVPVYGLGQYADGRPFYAMQFIRGDSLKEAIGRFYSVAPATREPGERSLELRQLLRRFIDVCNAIEFAHSRGVLHRDLKPGNIMLGRYGETLVVDWGLAKLIDRPGVHQASSEPVVTVSSGSAAGETMQGLAIGTPAYMSPEQAAGRLDLLGPASDVYSLGATLYSILTGRSPFDPRDSEILRKVQKGAFAAPRDVVPQVPKALEAVCLKAMAKEPGGRYETPLALARDVERFLGDEPVSAVREPLTARLARWARRHRAAVLSAVAALAVATVGLVIATVLISGEKEKVEQANATVRAQNVTISSQNRELERSNQSLMAARSQANESLVGRLGEAEPQSLPDLMLLVRESHNECRPMIQAAFESAPNGSRAKFNYALSLVELGALEVSSVLRELREGPIEQIRPATTLLTGRQLASLRESSLRVLQDVEAITSDRFRAACCLASSSDAQDVFQANATWLAQQCVQLIVAEPSSFAELSRLLEPQRRTLRDPLEAMVRDHDRALNVRQQAAALLATFSDADTARMVNLLLDDGGDCFAALFPALRGEHQLAIKLCQEELARAVVPVWADALQPTSEVPPSVAEHFSTSQGWIEERFAFAQTMKEDVVRAISEDMARAGYRPLRMRPFRLDGEVRISSVWKRDGVPWQWEFPLKDSEIQASVDKHREANQVPIDLAAIADARADAEVIYSLLTRGKLRATEDARVFRGPENPGNVFDKNFRETTRLHNFASLTSAVTQGSVVFAGVFGDLDDPPFHPWDSHEHQPLGSFLTRETLGRKVFDVHISPRPQVVQSGTNIERGPVYAEVLELFKSGKSQEAVQRVERAVLESPSDLRVLYDSLAVLSEMASLAPEGSDGELASTCRTRALQLFSEWTLLATGGLDQIDADPAIRLLLDAPGIEQVMPGWARHCRFTSLRNDSSYLFPEDRQIVVAESPELHLMRARQVAAQGFRPISISLLENRADVGSDALNVVCASAWSRPPVSAADRDRLQSRQANAAICLFRLGESKHLLSLFEDPSHIQTQTYALHRMASAGVSSRELADQLRAASSAAVKRCLLIALSEMDAADIQALLSSGLQDELMRELASEPSPGVHSMIMWFLERYGVKVDAGAIPSAPNQDVSGGLVWRTATPGLTMAVITPDQSGKSVPIIDRCYELSTTEIPYGIFAAFQEEWSDKSFAGRMNKTPAPTYPIMAMAKDQFAFCNWLSQKNGIPEDQWCYLPDKDGRYTNETRTRPNHLELAGFRLPTKPEWQYACHCGTATDFSFGDDKLFAPKYIDLRIPAMGIKPAFRVGSRLPNPWGLFDMHGGEEEPVSVLWGYYNILWLDRVDETLLSTSGLAGMGGSWNSALEDMTSNSSRDLKGAKALSGFRVARTVTPGTVDISKIWSTIFGSVQ